MNYQINPRVISPPAANYSHAVLSTNPEKMVHTSGVVPVNVDGETPPAISDQADLIWSNITDILREAHLELSDIVSITTYVMHSRDQQLGNHKPASTLVVVQELANAEWKMEISVVAIK